MPLEPIPVARAVYLNLLLDVLRESGGDCEAELQRFNLPSALPDAPDIYVPLKPMLSFSRWAGDKDSIDDIGLRAGSRMRLPHFEGKLRDSLHRAPSLGAALRTFCSMAEREQAPLRYRIVQDDEDVRIDCTPGTDTQCCADICGEWLRIMPVVAIVRFFAGNEWTPTTIAFRSHRAPGQYARRAFPHTSLVTGNEGTCLVFPASLLRLTAIRGHRRRGPVRTSRSHSGLPGQEDWGFPASLQKVLRAYLDDGHPTVDLAAEIAGTTVRTLQRRLGQHGLTYSDILARVRFDAAKHLLHDRELKVSDAAYALGYSDPAHFTRAFRRIAGVSPRRYRQEQTAA